jgi:molecular chaperone DnaJ
MPGPQGAPSGDLYVEIDVEEDTRFERDGADLVTRFHVSFADAALGAEVRVPALGDAETEEALPTVPLKIPAGTQSGSVFTIKNQGIPRLDGRGRGSLIGLVQVDVPTALGERAKQLIQELDAELKGTTEGDESAASARVAAAK